MGGEFVKLTDVITDLREQAAAHEKAADEWRRLATYADLVARHADAETDLAEAKSLEDSLRASLIRAQVGDAVEDDELSGEFRPPSNEEAK